MAARDDLEIHKMDAVAAFLNGTPKEDIYLQIPQGFEVKNCTDCTALKVKKSIYGLKQSPRCWYKEMHSFIESIKFRSSTADTCLFISRDLNNRRFFHVHVEDMTIAGTPTSLSSFRTLISNKFEMEDLGEATDILGISLSQNHLTHTMLLSQDGYSKNLLQSYNMQD